jgi:hypothetical protein
MRSRWYILSIVFIASVTVVVEVELDVGVDV